MGLMRHHAIIATTWSGKNYMGLLAWIGTLGEEERSLFAMNGSLINGYQSVTMVPDGSKEGWDTSRQGDDLRNRFISRLEEDRYEDDSSPWDWVEVSFGELGPRISRSNTFKNATGQS
jgi:hypothetical protein